MFSMHFRSVNRTVWFFCFVLLLLQRTTVNAGNTNSGKKSNDSASCSAVRATWTAKGFGANIGPATMVTGDSLSLCSQGRTCCTKAMEEKLKSVGKQEFLRMSNGAMSSIRHDFVAKSTKFKAFCIELVENSTKDLHDMFQKTYGLLYLQNAQIFGDLFRNLQNFFRGRDLDLHEVLERFFTVLFQKMFALLNTSYDFDKKYLDCVAENMDDLKPFGDVPQKLSVHVRRAFIAATTFMQGLRVGQNALHKISKVETADSCSHGMARMLYCPYCKNLISLKPCVDYCRNVVKDCFQHLVQFSEVWSDYTEAMLKVADRLEGPFNIESVIEPLDVKISDAIMNFQENSEAVTSKVFQECGQPALGSRRRKRQTIGQSQAGHGHKSVRPSPRSVTALDQVIMEIREVLTSSKSLWPYLVTSSCATVAAPLGHDSFCWDGKNKIRLTFPVGDHEWDNFTKSSVSNSDSQKSNSVIEQQILQLKLVTSNLHNAYAGQEVNSMDMDTDGEDDDEDDQDEFSGDTFPPSTPLPPPHHRRHHPLKNHNNFPVIASTLQPWDVYGTKPISNGERSRTQAKKWSRNASLDNRPFLPLLTFALILAFSRYINRC